MSTPVLEAELFELLALATAAAEAAGRLLLGHWSAAGPTAEVAESVRSKSTRTDLVTAADHASEALITTMLTTARPADAILAEEGSNRDGTSGLTWVVDPLDGTINFVYGLPGFGVSIACRAETGVLVGVVHDPVRHETFTACLHHGARRDGVVLRLEGAPPVAEALVGTGFAYDSRRRGEQAHLVAAVLPQVRDIRRAGAAAVDLCSVAAGRLDAHYEAGLAPWDMAAGSLIVTEAGGSVEMITGLLPSEPDLATLLAAAPGLGGPLRTVIEEAARGL